jgi:hypothetical protein
MHTGSLRRNRGTGNSAPTEDWVRAQSLARNPANNPSGCDQFARGRPLLSRGAGLLK